VASGADLPQPSGGRRIVRGLVGLLALRSAKYRPLTPSTSGALARYADKFDYGLDLVLDGLERDGQIG
jgi:hypothetical protein